MEGEPNNEPQGINTGAGNEPAVVPNNESKIQTFDEVLSNKEYQAEFDRRVQKSIQTAQANWQAKQDETKTEEERLARMNETEKLQYKLEQQEKANQDIQKRLNARDLKDEAIKIATNPDTAFDPEFLNLIDFENISAEQLNDKTKVLKTIQDRITEKAINEFSKEPSPRNVSQDSMNNKEYTLTEIGEIYKENPERASELMKKIKK